MCKQKREELVLNCFLSQDDPCITFPSLEELLTSKPSEIKKKCKRRKGTKEANLFLTHFDSNSKEKQ